MVYTNFPDGVTSYGVPVIGSGLPITTGNYWFVSSVLGSSGNPGNDASLPYATLQNAIDAAAAGDVIILLPNHAETISTAAGILVDVAGLTVIGQGEGATRPTFTFSATAATFSVTAASFFMCNVIGKPSIDSVVAPFSIAAANCTLGVPGAPIEWQDASATVEAVRAILTTTAANDLAVNLVYKGFITGNAVVNAVRLVGADNARIYVDFYGVLTTAVVEMITTACTNVEVTGLFYVSGITNFSRNVVDTGGINSTWSVQGWDAAAGQAFSGGSASPVAGDDVSAIAAAIGTPVNTGGTATIAAILGDPSNVSMATNLAKIGTITNTGGTATIGATLGDFANTTLISKVNVPTADSTANVSVTEVVGNKTDAAAAVGVDKSIMANVKQVTNQGQKLDAATLAVSPTAGSLATFIASGGTALGTPLAASKSLVDALGSNGTAVTDSAVSVLGAIGANNANNAFDSSTVVANANGSTLERLEYVQSNQLFQLATFTQADISTATPTAWTTVNSPITLFTVTGTVLIRCFGVVTTGFTSTAANGTVALGIADNVAMFIAATTADATNFATGDVWTTTTTAKGDPLPLTSGWTLVNTSNVTATIATNNMTAGGIIIYAQWIPISAGATVV